MGILKRFKDIMSANINAMLDKAEDPEKMIDQYLRDLQEDLRNVNQRQQPLWQMRPDANVHWMTVMQILPRCRAMQRRHFLQETKQMP